MINQNEVSEYLQASIPEMKELLVKETVSSVVLDAYKAVKCLTDFTLKNAHEHNIKMLKRCLKAAEKLYKDGNSTIKNAVENIFIYSFSILFSGNTAKEKMRLQSMIPAYFYSMYIKQITNSNY